MPILTTRGAGSIRGFGFGGGASMFIGTFTISSDTYDYDMRAAAIAGGWDGASDANITVTLNSGVNVGSTSTGNSAFTTGSPWPAGSILNFQTQGLVVGKGGDGGSGGNTGGAGAPGAAAGVGINAQRPITINNLGTIAGGGGGGGGGQSVYWPQRQGPRAGGGGGGGGGIGWGSGGAGGSGPQGTGSPGASGNFIAVGVGGNQGGGGNFPAQPGFDGGNYGSSGGGSGGAGGTAITGYPLITFTNTGTIYGPTT